MTPSAQLAAADSRESPAAGGFIYLRRRRPIQPLTPARECDMHYSEAQSKGKPLA